MRRLCLAAVLATSLAAVEVPAVPAMPDAQVYAVGVIPDLRGLLKNTAAAVAASGTALPAGMLEMGVGGLIGDPMLSGLGDGPILVAAGPGLMVPSWGAVLPYADPAAVIQAVTGAGLLAEAVPGGVAIGSAPDGPGLAKRMLPALPALRAGMAAGADLRLLIAGDRLATAYLPMAMAAMQGLAAKPGQPAAQAGVQRMGVGMIGLLRTLMTHVGPTRLDLTVAATGWKLDVVQALRPGVLADACKPLPAATEHPEELLGPGDGTAAMVVVGRFPTAAYGALATVLQDARRDPAVASLIAESVPALIRDCDTALTGSFAMRQGFDGNPMRQFGVMGLRDAAKGRDLMKRSMELMSGGAIGEMMQGMGLTVTYEESVRKSGNVAVDRVTYVLDPAKAAPGQAELPPAEMVLAGKTWIWGSPSSEIDAALRGARGKPRLSAEALGAGWDLYADYDLVVQMKMQFAAMATTMPFMAGAFADVSGGHPVRMAAAVGDGRWRAVIDVPTELVADMQKGFAGLHRGRGQDVRRMRKEDLENDMAVPKDPAAPVF